MPSSITLTTHDHAALSARVAKLLVTTAKNRAPWLLLREELERAVILPPEVVPGPVARIGSLFTVRDLDTDERDTFTLVWPEQANVDEGRLSVLTPLGTAVIGYAQGDEILWNMPGGRRRLLLEAVDAPAVLTSTLNT
jgi:regulator of nucleoside diphosphate kinase